MIFQGAAYIKNHIFLNMVLERLLQKSIISREKSGFRGHEFMTHPTDHHETAPESSYKVENKSPRFFFHSPSIFKDPGTPGTVK